VIGLRPEGSGGLIKNLKTKFKCRQLRTGCLIAANILYAPCLRDVKDDNSRLVS